MMGRSKLRVLQRFAVLAFAVGLLFVSAQSSRAVTLSLVPNSLQPDTVFQEFPFTLGFIIKADTLTESVDSAFATISVLKSSDSSLIGILFDGPITESAADSDLITYSDIVPQSINWGGTGVGQFALQLSYQLYAGDSVGQFQIIVAPGITRMPLISVAYQTGTLTPVSIEPGTTNSFAFDVLSADPYSMIVDEAQSRIYFEGSTFTDTAGLSFPDDSLLPALQTFTSGNVTIPVNLTHDTLLVSATLALTPKSLVGSGVSPHLYHLSFDGDKVIVQSVPKPTVQVVSLAVESPNVPKVNTGQTFVVRARIANRSDVSIGPISFRLSSDGHSSYNPNAVIQFIPAHSEADVAIDVTADNSPNDGEIFRLAVASTDVDVLPALDDVAFIIVELPASLKFSSSLIGVQNGVVGYGQTFTLNFSLQNIGDAAVNEATYLITTGDVNFGAPDSIGGSITAGQSLTLNFRAPSFDTEAVIMVRLLTRPIDANSGQPAQLDLDSVAYPVSVRAPGGELFIEPTQLSYNIITPERLTDLFSLGLTNRLTLSGARIRLLAMTVDFASIGGGEIDPSAFIDWSVSGIYHGDELISVATPSGSRVLLAVTGITLSPQDTTTLTIRLQVSANAPHQFTFRQAISDIVAILIEGATSRQAQVVTSMPSTFLFSESYVVVGTTLAKSFIINNNPFDPSAGDALFAYELKESAALLFRLYSITGELVLEENFPEGDEHTSAGSHVIHWNGKNGKGDTVLNGVYIATITNTSTGESARIKVAVVR